MGWYLTVLRKYAVFSGRARRREYWFFVLFNVIISAVLSMLDHGLASPIAEGAGPLSGLYSLAVLLPSLAVSVRRLHDTGRSGWWLLIGLVPLIGWLVLLFFQVQDSEPGSNAHGPNPKPVPAPRPAAGWASRAATRATLPGTRVAGQLARFTRPLLGLSFQLLDRSSTARAVRRKPTWSASACSTGNAGSSRPHGLR